MSNVAKTEAFLIPCKYIYIYIYNNYNKLYTVLSCLGVFTFCTCCKILICLACIVASFKLSCV